MAGLLARVTAGLLLTCMWNWAAQAADAKAFGISVPIPDNWSTSGEGPISLAEGGHDEASAAHIEIFQGESLENSDLEGLISQVDVEVGGMAARRIDWKDEETRGYALIFKDGDSEGHHTTVSFRAPQERWTELKPVFAAVAQGIAVGRTEEAAAQASFGFTEPEGWTRTATNQHGAKTAVYRNPDTAAPLKAVSVTEIQAPATSDLFERFLNAYRQDVVVDSAVTDVDEADVSGTPARVATLSALQDGEPVAARLYLLDRGDAAILVTALADAARPDALDAIPAMFGSRANTPEAATASTAAPAPEAPVAIVPFVPDPLQQVLFSGEMDERWRPNEAAGGIYEGNALFEDEALVVRMPENHGWAKAGLVSKAPIVWLDEFGDGAEIKLTFSFDPARTTGLGLSIGASWSPDPWSASGLYVQWNITADKTAGLLQVIKSQQAVGGGPFRAEGALTAPATIHVTITRGKYVLEAEGFAPVEVEDAALQPNTGLYITLFSSVPEPHLATTMAVRRIDMVRTPGAPLRDPKIADGVEPLPSAIIFPDAAKTMWNEMAVAGGDFATQARMDTSGLAVNVPENVSWGKVGIVSKEPLFVLDPTDGLAPYRLRFTFDPANTRAFRIAIKGELGPDLDDRHWVAAGISELDEESVLLFVHSSNEMSAQRKVPKAWGNIFDLEIVRDRVTAKLENGATVSLPVYPYGNGFPFYTAIMANPPAENQPTSFMLKSIEAGRVPPDGMDKAQRWLFVKDKDFKPDDFMDELLGDDGLMREGALERPHLVQWAHSGQFMNDASPAWRSAQAEPSKDEGDEAIRKRIEDRLSKLNRDKLDALMAHVGREPPKDFYGCLCGTYWRAGHVGVRYQDGKCHFSGFGEWDEPLPNDASTWASCVDTQRYDDGSSLVDVLAGEAKSLRDKKKAAAAASGAPKTGVGKGPESTVSDYDKLLAKHLTDLRMRGYPMNRIEQLNAMVRKNIMGLNQPGALPGFWESLGLASPPKEDAAELERWRRAMLEKWDKRFIGLLESGDPHAIMDGIRKTSQALGNYDEGMHQAAEGALDEIAGNQKFVEDVMSAVPVVGDAMDAIAVAGWLAGDGDWTLSGEKVTGLDALIRFAGIAGPGALEKLLGNSKAAAKLADEVGAAAHTVGKSGTGKAIAKGVGRKADDVAKGVEEISEAIAKKRKAAAEALDKKAKEAAEDFAKTPEGLLDLKRAELDKQSANELLEKLKKAEPGTPEFDDAMRQLQANKTAQSLINGDAVPDELRKKAKDAVEGWYKSADSGTKNNLKQLIGYSDDAKDAAKALGVKEEAAKKMRDQMAAYAKSKGLPLQDFKIEVKTITNKRPIDPNKPVKTSFGRDRDVTFEIVAPDGRRFDVDHEVSEAIYEQNFWKSTQTTPLPMKDGKPDIDVIHSYAHEKMDQTVTSKTHKEAYNPGEVALDDFLNKGMTPTITRVEDVRDTITYKSNVWFDRATKATDATEQARNVAEGMRQATKQYDDIIASRMKAYGMNPAAVPPQLQASINIFRQVEKGTVTAKQAESMLAAIGSSPRQAVKDMGSMFETIEKVTGKATRGEAKDMVASSVKQLSASGAPYWHNTALTEINNGLKSGTLSGGDFMKMRSEVIQDATRNLPADAVGPWAEAAKAKGLISAAEFDMLMQQK